MAMTSCPRKARLCNRLLSPEKCVKCQGGSPPASPSPSPSPSRSPTAKSSKLLQRSAVIRVRRLFRLKVSPRAISVQNGASFQAPPSRSPQAFHNKASAPLEKCISPPRRGGDLTELEMLSLERGDALVGAAFDDPGVVGEEDAPGRAEVAGEGGHRVARSDCRPRGYRPSARERRKEGEESAFPRRERLSELARVLFDVYC